MKFRLRVKIQGGYAAKPLIAWGSFANGYSLRIGTWALMAWWLSDNDYCDNPRDRLRSPGR